MHRRTFCLASASAAGLVLAGCTDGVGSPTGLDGFASPATGETLIRGTPFTVDVTARQLAPGTPRVAGNALRGTPIPMGRLRVTVTSGRGVFRITHNYKV